MTPSFLHLEDVVKIYPDGPRLRTVLNDIDLNVRQGEFVTLVGPSGCGKSTLLRLILGSETPTRGAVKINGQPIVGPDRDRGIVFQKYSLFPHLTVLQNVTLGLELEEFSLINRFARYPAYRRKRREYADAALEVLTRMGLGAEGGKYPQQLSGGMRQRVAIAQAMIMKPSILLMDEPFGALDEGIRQDMQLFILEQWEKTGMTIFFVTHDLEEALFLGTRILVLSQHYRTDCDTSEGAKIVTDKAIPGDHPKPTHFKYSPEMNDLLAQIRRDGLDPQSRRHVKEFDLSHADAWRTVSTDEWKDQPAP